jgi:hypothetical protein
MSSSARIAKDYTEWRDQHGSPRHPDIEEAFKTAPDVFADESRNADSKSPPVALPLSDLKRAPENDPDELIRHRYLCRGGGMLLVGPSGIGKSSFTMQIALCFTIGRPVFGITPARPLRILMIQAENDDGDVAEMRDGVLAGLDFSTEQQERACKNVFICRDDEHAGDSFFCETVIPLLEKVKPDLLIVDPAHAYHGGDSSAQADVSRFLRTQLNPVVRKHNCGVIVVHHTNKPPTGKEKSAWSGSEFAYLGSGSAEWANWSRAVLAIRQRSEGVFELIAAKRGRRLRWKETDGESSTIHKYIRYSTKPGVICWEEVPSEDAPTSTSTVTSKLRAVPQALLELLSPTKLYRKDAIFGMAREAGIGRDKCRELFSKLQDDDELFEHQSPRKGTRPELRYARFKPSSPVHVVT